MNDDQRSTDKPSPDDVEARLERLGNQPVDVPTARLDAIETRVRASMENEESDELRSGPAVILAGGASGVARRSSLVPRIALVAASILAVVALSIAVFRTGDDTLVVAAADDVVVLLPGGDSVIAKDGTELLDGSIVDVSGFVEVGGRRYGPGRYRVEDGRLVPIVDDPARVVSTDGDATEDAPEDPDAPTSEGPRPTSPDTADRPTVSSPRTTTPLPTRPANTAPPSTRPATTTPSRTTVPDRTAPNQTAPQRAPTTSPAPTTSDASPPRQPVTEPAPTVARPTTTTTTTTVVRRRPPPVEPTGDR